MRQKLHFRNLVVTLIDPKYSAAFPGAPSTEVQLSLQWTVMPVRSASFLLGDSSMYMLVVEGCNGPAI